MGGYNPLRGTRKSLYHCTITQKERAISDLTVNPDEHGVKHVLGNLGKQDARSCWLSPKLGTDLTAIALRLGPRFS